MTKTSRRSRTARRALAGAVGILLGAGTGGAAAQAAPTLPDLVVTDVTTSTGSYVQGSQVVFRATIRNDGAAKVDWTTNGVAFVVDGRVVSWSDDNAVPLAPGQSVTVTANAGPAGSKAWTATAGRHAVRAWVDDVNRIREANEGNNVLERQVTVAASKAKPVTDVRAVAATTLEQYKLDHAAPVRVTWKVPVGQPAGTRYTVVEHPATGGSSLCEVGGDTTKLTTSGTSATVTQTTGKTCGGHSWQYDSTFSVVATDASGVKVDSAASGTCTNHWGRPTDGGGREVWWFTCADGGSVSEVTRPGTAVTSVDAGGPGDTGFTGGSTYTAAGDMPEVWRTTRWGWSRYEVPVPAAATYEVELLLVEPTWTRAGQRVFDLSVEGGVLARGVDIAATAGRGHLVSVTGTAEVNDGVLTIDATKLVDNPIVSEIRVAPLFPLPPA